MSRDLHKVMTEISCAGRLCLAVLFLSCCGFALQALAQDELLEPGDLIEAPDSEDALDAYFFSSRISVGDEVYERIDGKSYRENDVISLSDLRYLRLLHFNFEHEVQVGEMIVHKNIADSVLGVFKELFQDEYEIQSVFLVDNYWTGDPGTTDEASVEENNTSCFNFRSTTGGGSLSMHAYGCAIDINPQQNPYVWFSDDGTLMHTHENADAYVDRGSGEDHMILPDDTCCTIFKKYGFTWGGDWSNPIDYQHFEIDAY